jgi:hypothetical protein
MSSATAAAPSASSASASTEVAHFAPATAKLHYERILRIQGYAEFSRIRPAILRAAEAAADAAPKLARPQVAYAQAAIEHLSGDELVVANSVRFRCAAFGQVLAGCTDVVAFVLTLGPGFDARVIELCDDGDLLDALLLETAAWLCVEDATRQFRSHLRGQAAARGQRTTSRMGPGYSYRVGDTTAVWALDEQPRLFSLFGAARLPVTLMDSCAMHPKMSRSGLVGIGPARVGHSPGRRGAGNDYEEPR